MHHEILYKPSYALAVITLDPGESMVAESGAMVSMSDGIEIDTAARGGLLGGLRRSVLGGESFFQNTFTATRGGELTLAPPLPGDIVHLSLNGETVMVQSGSYLASSPGIEVDTKWGGGKAFFSKEGLFLLRVSGYGDLFVSSYGSIHEVALNPGEAYTVDTGHMVAFDSTIDYDVRRVGGLKSTLFSGEGLVATYRGTGRLFIQTRSADAYLAWLIPQIPKK